MPRPSLTHDGFLIPNASDVSNPRMAEPDRIDFNTVAHARWGVIEGCLVTVTGSTAQCALGGLAIVDGKLVSVSSGQSVNVGVGGALDRFDLVAVNAGGTLVHIGGTPAEDPVFPDPPTGVTVLAAVYAPTGTANLADNVIDKRKFVSKSLLTKIPVGDPLIQNRNGTGDEFLINGGGVLSWKSDASLFRSAPYTIRIIRYLTVDEDITAGGNIFGKSLTTTGQINGSNLQIGAVPLPSVAEEGALYQDTSGKLWIRKGGAWKEIATIEGAVPTGSIITSVEPPSVMSPLGWVPFQGQTVTESQYPNLFNLVGLAGLRTGTAPNRSMVLPNAEGKMFATRWGVNPLTTGGNTDNKVSLLLANMPKHKHAVTADPVASRSMSGITISRTGGHIHGMAKGGKHIHWVVEHPHVHEGMDNYGTPAPVIAVAWGGRNKIDALFNDRNHTYSVEKAQWTMPAVGEVDVLENGSEHAHILEEDGDHSHTASGTIPGYTPSINEEDRGSGTAFDITPSYLSIYTYIRS